MGEPFGAARAEEAGGLLTLFSLCRPSHPGFSCAFLGQGATSSEARSVTLAQKDRTNKQDRYF